MNPGKTQIDYQLEFAIETIKIPIDINTAEMLKIKLILSLAKYLGSPVNISISPGINGKLILFLKVFYFERNNRLGRKLKYVL